MFNFQKEVVLNSLDKVMVVPDTGTDLGKKLRIHDGGEYFAKYVVGNTVYKTPAQDGKVFELTLDPATLTNTHVQVLIELGLDNDYRGDYGSALFYFRKPLLVDVVLPATEPDKVLETALKAAVPAEYKFVTVKAEGGKVIVTGADSYQKVRKVVITEYSCDPGCEETPETELINVSGGELVKSTGVVKYEANVVELGTYDHVLHNLRLPTVENTRFTSPNASEMPVRGAKYTQYTFAYCVPRVGFGGMSVVGQTNYSTTTHTFYVREDGDLAKTFEEKLKEIGLEPSANITRANEEEHKVVVVADNFASKADLEEYSKD